MGKRLANEFSWSFSRQNTFQECKKKYWYTYYGSWEGWPKTPYDTRREIDPLAAHLYMLKHIKHVAMFVGTCVHEAIEAVLKKQLVQRAQELPAVEVLVDFATKKFRQGIAESRAGKWKESPKKYANLFEYYFRLDDGPDPLTAEIELEGIGKIEECLRNWHLSPIAKMAFDPRARTVSVEELSHFMLDQYKIIVVIDFVMRWMGQSGQESMLLFDWKTGSESEKTEEQLYSYALYAHHALGMAYDRIILSPFYLASNRYSKIGYQQSTPLEMERLQLVQNGIVSSCQKMAEHVVELVPQAGAAAPDVRLFPYTDNRALCGRCPFQRVCQGAKYETLSQGELRSVIQAK